MTSTQIQPSVFQRADFCWDAHQAYLFDIDGTLLRCRDRIHVDAFLSSARSVIGRDFSLEGVVLSGNTDPGILRDAFRVAKLDEALWQPHLENILQQMRNCVDARRSDFRIDKMPGVDQVLSYLHAKGATLGLATGNLESIGWLKIEHLGLRSWFAFGGFSDRFHLRSDMVAEAIRQARALTGPQAAVCVIGDTPADIAAARTNAVPSIAVATGNYTFEQLMEHQPDACASNFLALLEATHLA